MLKQEVPPDGHVLDAGCGTGLSGKALHAAGFRRLTGIDISQASLDVAAQAGVYERLDSGQHAAGAPAARNRRIRRRAVRGRADLRPGHGRHPAGILPGREARAA